MHYLIASNDILGSLTVGCHVVADGETLSFEEPWSFGTPTIIRVENDAALEAIKAKAGLGVTSAFAVEGLEEPGQGKAFAIGAHLMRDVQGFAPYAAAVPDVIRNFGCRYIARGGTVTPIAGTFVPDRAVVMEFPDADALAAFYFSEAYAPLLKIRLATTDPRFVMVARAGEIPDSARRLIADKLRRDV
jgi:uncharacterized protein (DUF1330 family)